MRDGRRGGRGGRGEEEREEEEKESETNCLPLEESSPSGKDYKNGE